MQNINSDNIAHSLARYRNHLEFNGYAVEEENSDVIICRHPRKHNLIVRNVPDRGALIIVVYSCNPSVSRINLLEYVNQLNLEFVFMKAYIDEDDLRMETFFEGNYDRTNFSILLDNIEYDMGIFAQNELTREYLQ